MRIIKLQSIKRVIIFSKSISNFLISCYIFACNLPGACHEIYSERNRPYFHLNVGDELHFWQGNPIFHYPDISGESLAKV